MSLSARETVERIQTALEPHIRPREEVSHIRKLLSLQLLSSYENGPQPGSLALAGADCIIKSTAGVRGLQRDYLKALHANIKAKQDQEAVRQGGQEGSTAATRALDGPGRLQDHLTIIKLKRKHERLQAVEKYLDLLSQKPAASHGFVEPEEIFKNGKRLPEVPKTVVSGFAVNSSSAKPDLKAVVDRLEKAVLRSKLLLKKEEQLLEEVKSRCTAMRGEMSDCSKLGALCVTRDELISWMEAELGKASRLDDLQHGDEDGKQPSTVGSSHVHGQLATVKDKYANYVAARKALVQLVQQPTHPEVQTEAQPKDAIHSTSEVACATSTHLITPYIEHLIRVGQEQRSSIAQKAHITTALARQTEEAVRTLDRLREESQLIPDHPMIGAARRKKPGDEVGQLFDRVQPWVFAADAAKLATLEAVAEKIEEGQLALEKSTKSLAEIDHLLGRNTNLGGASTADEDTTIDDIWLAEPTSPSKGPTSKGYVRSTSSLVKEKGDIWSTLDGSVGLINAEDSPRKLL